MTCGSGGEFELAEEDYSAADDKPKAPFRIQIISSSSPSSSSSSQLPRRLHTPVLLPPLPLWSPVMTGGRRLNNKNRFCAQQAASISPTGRGEFLSWAIMFRASRRCTEVNSRASTDSGTLRKVSYLNTLHS